MLFKVLVTFVVLTGCCCWASRIKRQEDGEFWWLNKEKPVDDEALVEVEPIAEAKSNSPDESKIANIKQGKDASDTSNKNFLNYIFAFFA